MNITVHPPATRVELRDGDSIAARHALEQLTGGQQAHAGWWTGRCTSGHDTRACMVRHATFGAEFEASTIFVAANTLGNLREVSLASISETDVLVTGLQRCRCQHEREVVPSEYLLRRADREHLTLALMSSTNRPAAIGALLSPEVRTFADDLITAAARPSKDWRVLPRAAGWSTEHADLLTPEQIAEQLHSLHTHLGGNQPATAVFTHLVTTTTRPVDIITLARAAAAAA